MMYKVTYLHGTDIDNCVKLVITYKEDELPIDLIKEFFIMNPELEGKHQVFGFEVEAILDQYSELEVDIEKVDFIKG